MKLLPASRHQPLPAFETRFCNPPLKWEASSAHGCSDNQLCTFNRKLETLKWDMEAWRATQQRRLSRDAQEGFDLLNLGGDGGWDLLTSLMQYQPNKRLSASGALRHRWFGTSILAPVGAALDRVAESVGQVCPKATDRQACMTTLGCAFWFVLG